MRLTVPLAVLTAALLFPAAANAELVSVGTDPATGPAPTAHCGAVTCSATQLAPEAALVAPASGRITQLRLRHGKVITGSLMQTTVRVQVYSRSGSTLTLQRQGAAVTMAASDAADQLSTITTDVAVNAGELVGVQLASAWAGSETPILGVVSGETAGRYAGYHASGSADYAAVSDQRLLASIVIDTAATGTGGTGGDGGDGGAGGDDGDGGGGTSTGMGCESLATIAAGYPTAWRRGSWPARGRGWAGRVIGRQDNFNEVSLALDARGRPHVAGRGVFRGGAFYFGPRGSRQVGRAEKLTGDGVSVTLNHVGQPVLSWGSTDSVVDASGLIRYCPALWTSVGPRFTGTPIAALADGQEGFSYSDTATDSAGRVHAAYELGERLYYDPPSGAPLRLALPGKARGLRMVIRGTRVAIAARTDGDRLVLFTGSRTRFAARTLGTSVGEFDVAFGADRRPRVAFADGAPARLAVFDGRRVVRTDVSVGTVGLGMRGNRPQVVFTRSGRPTCMRFFGCLSNGIHHLDANASVTRGRFSMVQSSVGYSPSRLSVAVRGSLVAVAYGDPGNNGWLTVRSRRVR